MAEDFDVRKHGGLFASVEDFDKGQEFIVLASDLFGSTLEFEIRKWVDLNNGPEPVVDLKEQPNWSIWVYPKGRPGYAQAYLELGSKLGYLARLLVWPTSKYPLEAITL